LASAFAIVVADPRGSGGFFYHPHLMAVVHLVTLGFISGSILGAIFLVGPLALRPPLPARRLDGLGFAACLLGVSGMVSHFWMTEPKGVVWAATLVVFSFVLAAGRLLRALYAAPLAFAAKLPIALAFANLLAAGGTGWLAGLNKSRSFLPCSQLEA